MKRWAKFRYDRNSSFIGSDKYQHGDLFGMCYLPEFRDKSVAGKRLKVNDTVKRDLNIYAICDSYLESFIYSDSILYAAKSYWHSRFIYDKDRVLTIDTTQKNVLIIEHVERLIRNFTDSNYVFNKLSIGAPHGQSKVQASPGKGTQIRSFVFNPGTNDNLEFNLFDYKIFTPFKELKAYINHRFFDRINPDVVISPDKKYLLYSQTVDSSYNSAFVTVSDAEVKQIVNTLNRAYLYYRSKGFTEVYLSIMPNSVSILFPELGKYNNIITRIQNDPDLKMPFIDTYGLFEKNKATTQIYQFTDTHWTYNGLELWVNNLNEKLKKLHETPKK
ncbi:hypothetical protein ACFGVR_02225 [Mucilaginibacter sp. AW1-3]